MGGWWEAGGARNGSWVRLGGGLWVPAAPHNGFGAKNELYSTRKPSTNDEGGRLGCSFNSKEGPLPYKPYPPPFSFVCQKATHLPT